jgi:FKBP-type peptidyl-prolyl cis-trans isomerase
MKHILFVLALGLGISSCNKLTQAEKEDLTIQNYLSDHGLTATKTESGLYIVVNNLGNGASCNSNSDVRVSYKGYYDNGEVFDQSGSNGVEFNLQNVIKGWTEGIPHFKEEGEGILLIPSHLGYGSAGKGSVPGNTVLIFNIKLIDVL